MQERDYLLRQLQVFAQALAEAISLRFQGKILEANYMLDDLIRSDKQAKEIVDMPLDEFIAYIDLMQDFDADKWDLVAEALYEKAMIFEVNGQFDIARRYEIKAMHLVLEVLLTNPETYRQRTRSLLEQMRSHIAPAELPMSTVALLEEYAAGPN
jgi:hypothetical protein